ncbi:MAG: hypothetical protein IPI44_14460 [Sulfuritalea sp.]|nr:hypothetical protein [Sulfuritalea sp.]
MSLLCSKTSIALPHPTEKPKNFPAMLEQFKGEIARARLKNINPGVWRVVR